MITYFLHIPKAGGSTFNTILKRIYHGKGIFDIIEELGIKKTAAEQYIELSNLAKQQILLLSGHMFFGIHKCCNDKNFRYITFLRDPVDRVISHYYFVLSSPNHYLHNTVAKRGLDLLDYALSDLSYELDNGMTRILSGIQNQNINQGLDKCMDMAITNLTKSFTAIGLTEKYDESLILFKNKLKWDEFPFYRSVNITPKKGSVSDLVREKISERNKYDINLYNWAKEYFNSLIEDCPNFNQDLTILRGSNLAYNQGFSSGRVYGYQDGFIKGTQFAYNKLFSKYPVLDFIRKAKLMIRNKR